MKKIFFLLMLTYSSSCFAQPQQNSQLDLVKTIKQFIDDPEAIKAAVNAAVKDTNLYNTVWQYFISQSFISDSSSKWHFFKDMNVKFKTFQSEDSTKASIGFSYDFNLSYARYKETKKGKNSMSLNFAAQGNVAFNKNVNPNNFLVDKLDFSFSKFTGGVNKVSDTDLLKLQRQIRFKLAKIKDMQSPEAIKLWDSLGSIVKYRNLCSYAIAPSFGFESNQDFSRTQFTPGLNFSAGIKAWDDNNILAKLNVFDWPFAAIRYITKVDKTFKPYGATLPVISLGIDHVIPTNDTVREKLIGKSEAFERFRFEVGYRSLVTRVRKEAIFFDINYRYYYELNAKKPVIAANLDEYSYFVAAIQSTSGMYVSYSNGKLPFDLKDQQVYSIGFNYKF